MTQEKVREILVKHKKWIDKEDGGKRADLRGVDLSGAVIRGAFVANISAIGGAENG